MSPLFIIGVALLGLGIIIAPIVKKAVTRATKHNGILRSTTRCTET